MTDPQNQPKDQAYFSFWSYGIYCDCPMKYKIIIAGHKRIDQDQVDHGYAARGSVAHELAEAFFKLPPESRPLTFFEDHFQSFFDDFISSHFIDYSLHKNKEEIRKIAYGAVIQQVALIAKHGLVRAKATPEMKFRSEVAPDLVLGGRIDLVVEVGENLFDIWDWKATRNVDIQQLLFYIAGLEAQGMQVRKAQFALLKEGRVRALNYNPVLKLQLMKALRDCHQRIQKGQFQAQFNRRTCPRCEAREDCEAYSVLMENEGHLPTGPVSF